MSFGAGTLVGTVSIQLTISAQRHAGIVRATIFLLIGALLFSFVNAWLSRAGARHRKRCGHCVAQESEQETPGSGQAIAIGTIIDAVPEGVLLGVVIAQGMVPTAAIVAGIFLSNIPQSMSGSAGMYLAGRSGRYIVLVWAVASLATPLMAVLGSFVFAAASPVMAGTLDALSGGILLAMAMEAMIPEAVDKAPAFSGTVAVLGLAVIAAIAAFQ